jgi:hypothetical protein
MFEDFQGAEKTGTSLLLMVTANNSSASHILRNFMTESMMLHTTGRGGAKHNTPHPVHSLFNPTQREKDLEQT